MAKYIDAEKAFEDLTDFAGSATTKAAYAAFWKSAKHVRAMPPVNAVEVVPGYHVGDVCFYGFAERNKSLSLVEIQRIMNDERGVAEVKFLKVFVDDSGNGLFSYLLKTGGTMNASFKYLKNITPKRDKHKKG